MTTVQRAALESLIAEASETAERLTTRIEELLGELGAARQQRERVKGQEAAFRQAFERLFGNDLGPTSTDGQEASEDATDALLPAGESNPTGEGGAPADGATTSAEPVPRTDVVLEAVRQLAKERGFAAPMDVLQVLHNSGRIDTRDEVGSALSYLNRKGTVRNLGRGQWVPDEDGF